MVETRFFRKTWFLVVSAAPCESGAGFCYGVGVEVGLGVDVRIGLSVALGPGVTVEIAGSTGQP